MRTTAVSRSLSRIVWQSRQSKSGSQIRLALVLAVLASTEDVVCAAELLIIERALLLVLLDVRAADEEDGCEAETEIDADAEEEEDDEDAAASVVPTFTGPASEDVEVLAAAVVFASAVDEVEAITSARATSSCSSEASLDLPIRLPVAERPIGRRIFSGATALVHCVQRRCNATSMAVRLPLLVSD